MDKIKEQLIYRIRNPNGKKKKKDVKSSLSFREIKTNSKLNTNLYHSV